ncbi:MAG: YcaO-like family protein [Thermodesulfobacteriota bacterium]
MIKYKIKLKNNSATIGYFETIPENINSLKQGIGFLQENPYDDFLRNYLLSLFSELPYSEKTKFLEQEKESKNEFVLSLCAEAVFISQDISADDYNFDIEKLKNRTSLIYLKSLLYKDRKKHKDFCSYIKKNIDKHLFFKDEPPVLYPENNKVKFLFSLKDMDIKKEKPGESDVSFFDHVLQQFDNAGIIPGSEMRHFSSLSPQGILRRWYMKTKICTHEADFTFEGIQTSYGKGLDLNKARLTCLMEMTERISSFASIEDMNIITRKNSPEIIKTSYSRGIKKGLNLLDPNSLRLETEYEDHDLFWMKAEQAVSPGKYNEIYIPVQMSYLFCNLPEQSLFSSLDSTGLASGDTPQRAKLAGIFEAVERDCEYSSPFILSSCFRIKSESEEIEKLLKFYKSKGIDFFFQDISHETGIPCYKAFVYGSDNIIYKGCSAHFNGKKALIDALFEIPYPTIDNPPSKIAGYDLPVIDTKELPDYSTDNINSDLLLAEELLLKNSIKPVYSEITRPDLDISVFKTIIPGFEMNGDFDDFYRLSKRQYDKFKAVFENI